MDTTLTCLDWGNGLKIFFLPVLLSHRGPPLSLGASISSGVRRVGGDGLSSFEKSYKFFRTLKALAVLTLPYEKRGRREARVKKISVHSELGNLQNHSCPSQNRMCQLVHALTAVTDTSDVLRLSSEKQRIMHIVSCKRLVVCIK